jgi:hypothetical protein
MFRLIWNATQPASQTDQYGHVWGMTQHLIGIKTIIETFGKFPDDRNAANIAVPVTVLLDVCQLFYGHEKDSLHAVWQGSHTQSHASIGP